MDTQTAPKKVDERAFYLRWTASEGSWRQLEQLRLTRTDDDPLVPDLVWPAGCQVEVRVSVFEADGRLYAGAVEVRTAPEPINVPGLGITIPARPVDPMPIDTNLWRAVPLGALCREAMQDLFSEDASWVAASELADDPEAYARLAAAVSSGSRGRRTPGRPSNLSDGLLAFVADAVSHAGPRSAQRAAQRALQYAADRTEDGTAMPGMEFRGAADGQVTADQAKKAIQRARTAGLIPLAERKGRK